MSRRLRHSQAGFTLVELMIATMVFSVVLLVVTGGLMEIGRIYYRGVVTARTQETARSITDDIARAVQFGGGTIVESNDDMDNGANKGFCVGSRRYSYTPNAQLQAGTTARRFVVDTIAGSCNAASTNALNAGQMGAVPPATVLGNELLGDKMRVVSVKLLLVDPVTRLYNVSVRVAYGDDDVLCSPAAGDCDQAVPPSSTDPNVTDLVCKGEHHSSQFCATAEINTTVHKRLK